MAYYETSVKKGIGTLALGAFALVATGFCVYHLINGINGAEAAAIAGEAKENAVGLIKYTALGLVNFGLGAFKVTEGVYNLKEELVL